MLVSYKFRIWLYLEIPDFDGLVVRAADECRVLEVQRPDGAAVAEERVQLHDALPLSMVLLHEPLATAERARASRS